MGSCNPTQDANSHEARPQMLAVGECLVDPSTRCVFRGQDQIRLSPKAAAVLLALAETPGQVWSRDALLERVWPLVHVGEEVLTHAIAELRRAFSDDFRAPRYFATVHKSGYRLLATVNSPAPEGPAASPTTNWAPTISESFNLRAYATYLEACDFYERGGRRNTVTAVTLFSSVVQQSPGFALAHAGLAKALAFLDTYHCSENGLLDTALSHCATAHRITGGSAETHAAQGFVYAVAGDSQRSMSNFRSAIELRPDSAETHALMARACLAGEGFKSACIVFEHSAALKADDYRSLLIAGALRQSAGEPQHARADYALALPRIEARLAADPNDFRALSGKAQCLLRLGRGREADSLMQAVVQHPDPVNYYVASTLASAGLTGRALDVLEEVVDQGWRHGTWLDRDPDLDALRGHQRFKRIAAAISARNTSACSA